MSEPATSPCGSLTALLDFHRRPSQVDGKVNEKAEDAKPEEEAIETKESHDVIPCAAVKKPAAPVTTVALAKFLKVRASCCFESSI